MDEHRALEELQREIRDRRRLGMPTGDLPEREAEMRRELHLPPAAPKKAPGTPKQRRPLSNAQRKQLERWHKEHNSRGGVK